MFPAFSLVIVASTGGDQMEMGMVLPIAAMRVEHHKGATPEDLAPDVTIEVVQTLGATPHQRAQ